MRKFSGLALTALVLLLSIPTLPVFGGMSREATAERADPGPKVPHATAPGSSARGFSGKRAAPAPPPGGAVRTREERLRSVVDRLELLAESRRWGLEREVAQGRLESPEAVAQLGGMRRESGGSFRVSWNPTLGTLRFLAGAHLSMSPTAPGSDPAATVQGFLAENRALLRIHDPEVEFRPTRVEESREGFRAVRLQQCWQGIPIRGHDIVVRLDLDGRVSGLSGQYRATPSGAFEPATLSASDAGRAALAALRERDGVDGLVESADLLFCADGSELSLVWRVVVAAGLRYRTEAMIDARSGGLRDALTLIRDVGAAAIGHGVDLGGLARELGLWNIGSDYYLIDTRKPMFDAPGSQMPDDPRGAIQTLSAHHTDLTHVYQVTSLNPEDWQGKANAVSAAHEASQYYDFLNGTFGRSSFDGQGRTIVAVVDVLSQYNNAFWNGYMVCFGNGDNQVFSDLAGAMDVVGHELGHAVVETTANLVYEFQPGSLNEHFADVFGALLEWEKDPDHADWWIGEDVMTPGTPGDCLRNMEDPASPNVWGGPYPTSMAEYQNLPANDDHGGVHTNNTIPSRAFVLICGQIPRDEAAQIWYRALSQYLTRTSQFIDLRLATLQAAADLFGEGSNEVQAVAAALTTVGIVGDEGGEGPGDLPDNGGTDFIAIADTGDDQLYRVPPDWSVDPEGISGNATDPEAGGRPSFSDDGEWFVWVGADQHIYRARSNGADRVRVSTAPEWWSVALSADSRYLAATTVAEDGLIYVFDLVDPELSRSYELTTQNDTGGTGSDLVVFADVMEFMVAGDSVVYDAMNRAQLDGADYEYWDINVLRLADGVCQRLLPPLPVGESVGDPALAQNQDFIMAYDYLDATGHVLVRARNLETGAEGLVTDNYDELGRPTFSGDDRKIYYQYPVSIRGLTREGIWSVSLAADGLTGLGDDEVWGTNCRWPVWFTRGTRPSPVWLGAFEAIPSGSEVTVRWRAAGDAVFTGYELDRGVARGGPFTRLTPEDVPASQADREGFLEYIDTDPIQDAWYRLSGRERDGGTRVLGLTALDASGVASRLRRPMLLASSPSPFVNATTLRFTLPGSPALQRVDLSVHDASGRRVASPIEGEWLAPGEHRREWSGIDSRGVRLPAGRYYLRLKVGGQVSTQEVSLAR